MARKKDRTRRDQAGVGPDPETARRRRLVPLERLEGYKLADGEPDIRGWDVRTLSGRDIGEIEDLLIDPDHGEVVMVEVGLREGGVHAEVPIRSVQLDRSSKSVLVDSGDIDGRYDQRARDRMAAVDRDDSRDSRENRGGTDRRVTYGGREVHASDQDRAGSARDIDAAESVRTGEGDEEVVVERRPVIEEVVVRRRVVDPE